MEDKLFYPFATLVDIQSADWDVLGQAVLVRAMAGKPGTPGRQFDLALTPEAAESLRRLLNACEPGKAPSTGPAQ